MLPLSVVCLMRVSREETRSDIFYAHFIWSEPKEYILHTLLYLPARHPPSLPFPFMPLAHRCLHLLRLTGVFHSCMRQSPAYLTRSMFDCFSVGFPSPAIHCTGNLRASSVLSFHCNRDWCRGIFPHLLFVHVLLNVSQSVFFAKIYSI